MALDTLLCSSCAAPVPLVAGDHGTCPHCGASYAIPDTYQALRTEAEANARRPEALALIRALGKPPPMIVRAFAFFSSPLFVMVGLGFWIVIGLVIGVLAMPTIGRHVFHIITYDVWSEQRQEQFAIAIPMSTLVIGFTLTGWARKRGIVRGGLQAALAAAPPTRPGGPKECRNCAAPLAPEPGALAAHCAYCNTDNLVEMPSSWVQKMRAQSRGLTREIDAAATVWITARRALWRSLILRFVLLTVFLLVPWVLIMGAGSDPDVGYVEPHPWGPPVDLPRWRDEVKHRVVDLPCGPAPLESATATCRGGECNLYLLAPLRAGEVVTHSTTNLPAGSVVHLEMHEQTFLSEVWVAIASAPLSAGQRAKTRVPYSGWYRLHVTVPSDQMRWSYCASVR